MQHFRHHFYINHYDDLKELSFKDASNHFINHGISEKRIFNKKLKYFNYTFYINYYEDLKDLSWIDACNHFLEHGIKEKRIFNIILIRFQYEFYINYYEDLKELNWMDACNHFINKGIKEDRIMTASMYTESYHETLNIEALQKKKNILKNKTYNENSILIIYVYYERVNETKNQTNLNFFIKYGLDKYKWSTEYDITTLFVINNHQCEVIIPEKDDIFILKRNNGSDWEGWYTGIKYIEKIIETDIYIKFKYITLINCGVIGPIYEDNNNNHWLTPFICKLNTTNSVICTPMMSYLPPGKDRGGQGYFLNPYFSLLKLDINTYNLLFNTLITHETYTNTIYGKKINHEDALFTGEYSLTTILKNNNYNYTSLIENNDKTCRPDWDKKKIINSIFIKNIWRWKNDYTIVPILYNYCMTFLYKKININNNINKDIDIDYALIKKKLPTRLLEDYRIQHPTNNKLFVNKETYYKNIGYAEELIIFNKMNKNNKNVVIYAHYDKNNIIQDCIIQCINTLIKLNYDILFFTASEKIINLTYFPFKINYIKNDDIGTDWKIWLRGLKYLKLHSIKYEWILLLNDSIIFPINGYNNMKQSINNIRKTCHFWGHWNSSEVEDHIIGTPLEFQYDLINIIIKYIETNQIDKESYHFILSMEIPLKHFIISKGFKTNTIMNDKDLNTSIGCPTFNPNNILKWINNPANFAIKYKYCLSYLNSDEVSQDFRQICRYLYFGKSGLTQSRFIPVFGRSKKEGY